MSTVLFSTSPTENEAEDILILCDVYFLDLEKFGRLVVWLFTTSVQT